MPDPSSLAPVQMMVKCLGMPEYLDDALDLLIDEGIFKTGLVSLHLYSVPPGRCMRLAYTYIEYVRP